MPTFTGEDGRTYYVHNSRINNGLANQFSLFQDANGITQVMRISNWYDDPVTAVLSPTPVLDRQNVVYSIVATENGLLRTTGGSESIVSTGGNVIKGSGATGTYVDITRNIGIGAVNIDNIAPADHQWFLTVNVKPVGVTIGQLSGATRCSIHPPWAGGTYYVDYGNAASNRISFAGAPNSRKMVITVQRIGRLVKVFLDGTEWARKSMNILPLPSNNWGLNGKHIFYSFRLVAGSMSDADINAISAELLA